MQSNIFPLYSVLPAFNSTNEYMVINLLDTHMAITPRVTNGTQIF